MFDRISTIIVAAALAAGAAACITVNIYFPAPEVREAAQEIVQETWGGQASAPPTQGAGQSSVLDLLAPSSAWAQEADINVSTAAIRALKEAMKARAAELKPYLGSGNVGIGLDGMLVVRQLDGVSLRDQAKVRRLVDAENRDRRSLYVEIAEANKFGKDRVGDIQRIFAETWIDNAEKGWWIQKTDGAWKQK